MTTGRPAPDATELTEPFWRSLAGGALSFQRCRACATAWLPARHECPACLASSWEWEPSAGTATLVSWVVYHTAYHPYFEDKLPYAVGVVELDEGPRLIASLLDPPDRLTIEQRLSLEVCHEGDVHFPAFAIDGRAVTR